MENKIIKKMLTKNDLINIFKKIGITHGMILEVHTSLSKLDFIIGGAQTFNDALLDVIGYSGTIIMPMQNAYNSEPSNFIKPPIDLELLDKYRDNYPPYNKYDSDSYQMGVVVDNLRRREKAVCSNHPNLAFVAIGKYAKLLCNYQNLDFPLDDNSALGRLYELKASCLLVGVDYTNMTSLHLAEHRSEIRPIVLNGASIYKDGNKRWYKSLEIAYDSDDGFNEIGEILEKKSLVNSLEINNSMLKLVRIDVAIDTAINYYKERIKYYM